MNRRYRKKNCLYEYQRFCIVWQAPDAEYVKWRTRFVPANPANIEAEQDSEIKVFGEFLNFLESCDMGLGGWVGKAGIQKTHPYSNRLISCTQKDLDLIVGWLCSHEGWEGLSIGLSLVDDWYPTNTDEPWSRMRPDGTVDRYGWYRGVFRKNKERRVMNEIKFTGGGNG